jgi:hypothetical protein
MKLANFASQFFDTLGSYEDMVMVWEYAPCIYVRTKAIANPKNL